ncbi:MAG TPA: hypothetical protein VMU22_04830 [Rhizomicrobium sp.]|nr:hypothetical protein [Rhizomicrobium sp.]
MRVSLPLGLRELGGVAWKGMRERFAALAAGDFDRFFTRRTLGVIAIVSTTLCVASLAALAVVLVRGAGATPAVATGRPWLSPVSIHIVRAPLRSDGKPRIDVTLNYANVGTEPARGVVIAMRSGTVPETVSTNTLDAVFAGGNATCDALISPEDGAVVFPSASMARHFSQTDGLANEDWIANKQGVLVVQACIKYQTASGAIHTTRICQYVEPQLDKPLDQRRMRYCADGNGAD